MNREARRASHWGKAPLGYLILTHIKISLCAMKLSAKQTVDVLRAAGEPTRLRILALLDREELAVLELCRVLEQSQPRVSRHLKLLAEAGLVERFPDGAWVFYRLSSARREHEVVGEV